MKNLFILNIQSFTDIITNSSSELFVVNPENITVDFIREILEAQLEIIKKISNIEEENITLDDMLYIKIASHDFCGGDYGEKYKKGDILIHSQYDNSIPYLMMEVIDRMCDCKQYHLG